MSGFDEVQVIEMPDIKYREYVEEQEMALKTARKMHICVACLKAIQRGQKYWSPNKFGWQNRLLRSEWHPDFLPIRIHDATTCLERGLRDSRDDLPKGRAITSSGELIEYSQAPVDYKEVGWNRDTASSLYWHPDFDTEEMR